MADLSRRNALFDTSDMAPPSETLTDPAADAFKTVRVPEKDNPGQFATLRFPSSMTDEDMATAIDRDFYGIEPGALSNLGAAAKRLAIAPLEGIKNITDFTAGAVRASKDMPRENYNVIERDIQATQQARGAIVDQNQPAGSPPSYTPPTVDTAGQDQAWQDRQQRKEQLVKDVAVPLEKFRDVGPKMPPPVYKEGSYARLFEDGIIGMAQSLPIMIAGGVTPPPVAFAATWAQIGGATYQKLKEEGKSDKVAWQAANLEATFSTPIEYAGNLINFRLAGKTFNAFANKAGLGSKVSEVAKLFGKSFHSEGIENALQYYPGELAQIYADNPDASASEIVSKTFDKVATLASLKEVGREYVTGGIGGAGISAVGGAAGYTKKKLSKGDTEVAPETPPPGPAPENPLLARIASDVAEGRVTEEELRDVRSKIPDADPRAKAIDAFFVTQANRPQSRYATADEEYRQAELVPRPTRQTPEERQKQIWRETGYEAPPEAPVTPVSEQNQKTIDRLWRQYQSEIEDGTIQSQDDLLNEMVLDSKSMARPIGIETLRTTAEKMWRDLKQGPPRRTSEERQSFIDSETGITPQERIARTQQRTINTLWDKYQQGVEAGDYADKKTLIDEIRTDANDAGKPIPNPEIKKLADKIWSMARNPEISKTQAAVEDIPRRAAETRNALSWEEVLRTSPVNIEGGTPYASQVGEIAQGTGRQEGTDRGAEERLRVRDDAENRVETGPGNERIAAPPAAEKPAQRPAIAFKDTQEALAFGEKATPEQVSELKRLRDEKYAEAKVLSKNEDMQPAMEAATQGQFYREAVEASEGIHPAQIQAKTKPAPAEAPPKPESRRERADRDYKAYVASLPDATREAVKGLIVENPESPSIQTRKIQKAVAEFEKKPVAKPGPVVVEKPKSEAKPFVKKDEEKTPKIEVKEKGPSDLIEGAQEPTGSPEINPPTQEVKTKIASVAPDVKSPEFGSKQIISYGLKDAVARKLITKEEGRLLSGIMKQFPEAWRNHFDVRVSGQEFSATDEQKVKAGLQKDQPATVKAILRTEKAGFLKTDAKHIAVMFKGSNVTDFIHEIGEFIYDRALTPNDKKLVKQLFKADTSHPASMYRNEWFADKLEKWWVKKVPIKDQRLVALFRKSLAAVKSTYDKMRGRGVKVDRELANLFDDIITNGRDINEKYFYSDKEIVEKYVIGTEPSESTLQSQGFSGNSKTLISWDPSSQCPKQAAFVKFILDQIKEGDLRITDLANVETISGFYDAALAAGIEVPCSYCYVEQARRKAIAYHQEGGKTTMVNFAMAKQIYTHVPYIDAIQKWSQEKIDDINKRGGLRLFSFSDYIRGSHYEEVKKLLAHAKDRGLSVKAITKNPHFIDDFADTGITINVSVDTLDKGFGMDWDIAAKYKKEYPNVKVRSVGSNKNEVRELLQLEHAGIKNFIDIVTPYHHDDTTMPIPKGYEDMTHKTKEGRALQEMLNENPEWKERTCCQEGGKCFHTEHNKQCAANCGLGSGNLSVPQFDKSIRFDKGRPITKRHTGMMVESVQPIMDAVSKRWQNGPQKIVVVQHQHQLPEGILTWLKKAGAYEDIVRGVFHKDRVYLVADNFDNTSDAVRTLVHESFGHFGIQRMLGTQWGPIMGNVYQSHKGPIDVVAKEYGYDVSTDKGLTRATEEWLAREAETNPKSTIVERVVAAIRRMLRRAGLDIEFSDAEVRDLLVRAREYVQTGRPANMIKAFSATFSKDKGTPLWYSQMEQVLGSKLPGNGNPKAIAGILESWAKKGEFKAEELEWSGIADWLKEHKGATITKQELMDYLAENNVRVKEVVKGQINNLEELNSESMRWFGKKYDELPQEQQDTIRKEYGKGEDTVYSQYQLPGGENYRELLLTLPQQKRPISFEQWLADKSKIGEISYKSIADGERFRPIYEAAKAKGTLRQVNDIENSFSSTHYQEPNILAHVRFNERVDADGKRVLFIEEIQSDWAQQGRKYGFSIKDEDIFKWKEPLKEPGTGIKMYESPIPGEPNLSAWIQVDKKGNWNAGVEGTEYVSHATSFENAEKQLLYVMRNNFNDGSPLRGKVPSAPFVRDTGKWSMLAMKRMVRYAAENGFDRIAWTRGEQQAARYDLSKQVEKLQFTKRGGKNSGTYDLRGYSKDGQEFSYSEQTADQLENIIGKEITKRAVNELQAPGSRVEYSGLDLKVGGEGMKGFYDKILPSEVNKFFNKGAWGNAKVGQTWIPGADAKSMSTYDLGNAPLGYDVHSLDITPQMREKAMGGMPMFAKDKQQAKTYLDRLNESPEYKQMQADLTVPPSTFGMLKDVRKWANERFGKGYVDTDMRRLQKVLETPYHLAKKFSSMKAAMTTELDASEKRSTMTAHDYIDNNLRDLQDALRKDKAANREYTNLIWHWDGRRMPKSEVPTEAITWPKDVTEEAVINPVHYDEVRLYLKKQGVNDKAADLFVAVRQVLDKKLVLADQIMHKENVEEGDIADFRSKIGQKHNYFPHVRNGDSQVSIIDSENAGTDNAVVYREHYFWKADKRFSVSKQAPARARAWLENAIKSGELKGPIERYEVKDPRPVKGLPEEVFFQIPVEAMQQVARVAGSELEKSRVEYEAERLLKKGEVANMTDAMKLAQRRLRKDMEKALGKAISDVFKGRGWARHAIARKGIPGHETNDVHGILFDYITGFNGFVTKIQRAKEHSATLQKVNAKEHPEEYRYVSNYIKDMLANQDKTDRAVDTLKGLFFLKYLGFVLKSGFVNLTQNVVLAAPELSIYTNKANRKLAKAMYDVRKALYSKEAWTSKEVNYSNINADERLMLKQMIEQGVSIDSFLRELKGNIPGKNIYSQAIRSFADRAGVFMMLAEKFNRASTALAAYRVGLNEQGMSRDEAIKFAKTVVYNSHFVYGKHNRPAMFRGGTVRKGLSSVYQFRAFSHNYLNTIHYMITRQGLPGKLAAARSIRNTILVGGLVSMPFFKALSNAVMWAIGDDDEDAMTSIRAQLPSGWVRDLVTYGLPGLAGVDISGSLSLDMPQEWYEILGVPYAAYKDTLNMVASWQAGQTTRAIAESPITPMMVRNAMRGLDLYTMGQLTRSGRPINAPGEVGPRKIDAVDLFKKTVLGFQPVEIAKGYAQYQALDKAMEKADAKKKHLSDQYVNAIMKNDEETQRNVWIEVGKWNDEMTRAGKSHLMIDLKGSIMSRMRQPIQMIPKRMRGNALSTAEAWK